MRMWFVSNWITLSSSSVRSCQWLPHKRRVDPVPRPYERHQQVRRDPLPSLQLVYITVAVSSSLPS